MDFERISTIYASRSIVAMRGLFKLDDSSATDVEEALIAHGGGGALHLEQNDVDAAALQEAS